MKETMREYFENKMGEELIMTFSLDEIQSEWNITTHELFFGISTLYRYEIKMHPDFNWHIVLINKSKAHAIAERKKDLSNR